jgi:hypothetical protein
MIKDGQVQSLVASQCVGCGYGDTGLSSTWELSADIGGDALAEFAQKTDDL